MAGLIITDPITFANVLISNNVIPGDTLLLRSGTYNGNRNLNFSGNAQNYVTVMPYNNERVIINGQLSINGNYVRVMGLEITNNAVRNRSGTVGTVGVNAVGDYNEVVNCLIHDHDQGITTTKGATGHIYYGNLIYFNGWNTQFGHGIYPQNISSNTKTIKRNVFIDNFGYGIHCYGSLGANVSDFIIDGNACVESGEPRPAGYPGIIISGGDTIISAIVRNNMTYNQGDYPGSGGSSISFGSITGAQVYDNYVASTRYGITFSDTQPGITRFDGNTVYGWLTNVSLVDWPNNSNPSGHPSVPIVFPSSGTQTFLQSNEYNNARAQLIIYNWGLANLVSINLSSLAWTTGSVRAHNAQNYSVDIQTILISGSSIMVNMQAANRSVATPVSWTPPTGTFPRFGAFILEWA